MKYKIHYFTDILLDEFSANKIAKINMVNAFSNQKSVLNTTLYTVLINKSAVEGQINKNVAIKYLILPIPIKLSFYSKNILIRLSLISLRLFSILFFLSILLKKELNNKYDVVFARGAGAILACLITNILNGTKYSFEIHNYEFGKKKLRDFVYLYAFKKANKVITVSEYTKKQWETTTLNTSKVLVLPSGVNIDLFNSINKEKCELRKQLTLPSKKKVVMYTGKFEENRGIDNILYLAKRDQRYNYVLVGGTEEQIEKCKKNNYQNIKNIIFISYVPNNMIPLYMKAADVLVAPYSKKTKAVKHRSPIKLLEYMATNIPIVAADFPSIREVVSDKEVYFYEPDNVDSLYASIHRAMNNYKESIDKARSAYNKVDRYSWNSRTSIILDKITRNE